MQEIRAITREKDAGIKANDLKGTKVRAANGKEIGHVIGVRLDVNTFNLDGIEVDRGFFGKDTFIGRKYITSLSKEGAVLNMSPVSDYKGLKVFDSSGKEIGTVKEVRTNEQTNDISAIVVGTGFLKNDAVFSKSDVEEVGESIMLNVLVDANAVKVGGRAE
ncbi:MAG: PRC-barrel domain-containing protein [Candidatus Diapherotrites archaeon]|uniref:PRC-barrel domain-containing protein n=1 Tax=Candidatus Iainarchaeum sp. TaxID=3101447 RepID=A0A8T4L870_9ARCH|nr:PRC-barrel domain-containing protein [Candidatus Diapherotrites archaeon]